MTISDNKAETENSTEEFKGLPMRELIGAPLQAACKSQQKLAESTLEFMHIVESVETLLEIARKETNRGIHCFSVNYLLSLWERNTQKEITLWKVIFGLTGP